MAEPHPFEDEFPGGSESANASMIALVRTYDAWVALVHKALRHHGLSAAGRQALAVLDGAGEALSPTGIAQRLLVTTASMTSLLDTLERRGFITRLPDPTDRRGQLVRLTDEGQRVVDEFLPEIVALQTALTAGLSEAERRRLLRSLATIRDAISSLDADAVVAAAPPRVTPPR